MGWFIITGLREVRTQQQIQEEAPTNLKKDKKGVVEKKARDKIPKPREGKVRHLSF